MSALPKRRLTDEEYLAIERAAESKSELIDGVMHPMHGDERPNMETHSMAGAGERHGTIIWNIAGELRQQFKGRPCKAYTNDLRVNVANGALCTYPDVVALCGPPQFSGEREDALLNPQLIVEVLSPSAAHYDQGEKCQHYRRLATVTDYVLVSQKRRWVEHWSRQSEDGLHWLVSNFTEPTDMLRFASLGVCLPLSEIYDKVEFPTES